MAIGKFSVDVVINTTLDAFEPQPSTPRTNHSEAHYYILPSRVQLQPTKGLAAIPRAARQFFNLLLPLTTRPLSRP